MEKVDTMAMEPETEPIMSVKDWVITMLILMIPMVNIIMLFVWAFGEGSIKTRSNFAKAQLVIWLFSIALMILLGILFMSLGVFANWMPSSY